MVTPRPRVLVLDEEAPFPANTGKRLRTLNLISRLSRQFDIHLLVHDADEGTDTSAADAELARRGVTTHRAPSRLAGKRGFSFASRVLRNLLFSSLPYSVASHRHPAYADAAGRLIAGGVDLVHCEWTPYAGYVDSSTVPVVISAHNIETHIWDRLARSESRPVHRLVYRTQARRMKRFEKRVFSGRALVTAVSEGDAEGIRGLGARDVTVVPNGVDIDLYRDAGAGDEPLTLAFTGSMDWHPNQQAVRWFLDEVHPILRESMDYRLYLVGRNPPEWMRDRNRIPANVEVTGTVEDVRPFIAKSRVYVVPLRAGGGSRLKILEALAMKRAVVSTTVGAEGLDVTPGSDIVIADEPREFADAVLSLMEDENRRRALGDRGRALVEARYDWNAIAAVQSRLWTRAMGR